MTPLHTKNLTGSNNYSAWFNEFLLDYLNTDVGDTFVQKETPIYYCANGATMLCSAEAIRATFGEPGLKALKQIFVQDEGNTAKGFSTWTLKISVHKKVLRYLEKTGLIEHVRAREYSFVPGVRYARMRSVVAETLGRVDNPQREYDALRHELGEEKFDELIDEVTGWWNLTELKHTEDKPRDYSNLLR